MTDSMSAIFRKTAVGLLVAILLTLPPSIALGESQPREYQVKAVFIYNFTKFTTWPDNDTPNAGSINICIAGKDPFGKDIEGIDGKSSAGKKIAIKRLGDGFKISSLAKCQIVFISRSEASRLPQILAAVKGDPILTVSDITGFAEAGGMIGLEKKGKRIGMRINIEALAESDINISSKVLRLAEVVK